MPICAPCIAAAPTVVSSIGATITTSAAGLAGILGLKTIKRRKTPKKKTKRKGKNIH